MRRARAVLAVSTTAGSPPCGSSTLPNAARSVKPSARRTRARGALRPARARRVDANDRIAAARFERAHVALRAGNSDGRARRIVGAPRAEPRDAIAPTRTEATLPRARPHRTCADRRVARASSMTVIPGAGGSSENHARLAAWRKRRSRCRHGRDGAAHERMTEPAQRILEIARGGRDAADPTGHALRSDDRAELAARRSRERPTCREPARVKAPLVLRLALEPARPKRLRSARSAPPRRRRWPCPASRARKTKVDVLESVDVATRRSRRYRRTIACERPSRHR